jgi:isocitrate dehydrogenase
MSRPGCERIIRYAFEYARQYGRKKVTAFTKDNILKLSDGLFHKVFVEIAAQYPDIDNEHWIVDIGAAKLADTPEAFDVVVLPNLYGDILSDVAAQIAGSVGMAGSANIGHHGAMFEAIHGSAPKRAGQNVANPSGLLLAAVMMLVHIQQTDVAARIHNAWLKTIEDGIHTYDIFDAQSSKQKVGTREFAEAVIQRLNQAPTHLPAIVYKSFKQSSLTAEPLSTASTTKKTLVGVDIFLEWKESVTSLANVLQRINGNAHKLTMISNRGVHVWPEGYPETFCIDQWRCRFLNASTSPLSMKDLVHLLTLLHAQGLDVVKTENLYDFDGVAGFSQ